MRSVMRALSILLAMLLVLSCAGCQQAPAVSSASGAEVSAEEVQTQPSEALPEEASAQEPEPAEAKQPDYPERLFDTGVVHTINVEISEADWQDLRENPLEKTKYRVNVTIDGETVENVSFATKGNSSLGSVASDSNSDRYSFKVNFGKYVKGQTYHGLNKLNLNNTFADATSMKDYICYEIFRAAGVAAPLCSYIWVTVNGKDFGLYLAVEDISEAYLERTTDGRGELYKPETMAFEAGGGPPGGGPPGGGPFPGGFPAPPEDFVPPEDWAPPDMGEFVPPEGGFPPMPGGFPGPGGPGGNSGGASLMYTDDELESYSAIFDNAVTDVSKQDKKRVIAALKQLSEGDPESCLDTEAVIRYFAAHNFVMNYDSYTGNMLHNYYLYECGGVLSVLPWDYNLAFCAFGGGMDATAAVNCGIDSPLSGASVEDRPLWGWIVENEEYLEQYHQCCEELVSDYFLSGEFLAEVNRVYEMIVPYVEKDPTAFFTPEELGAADWTLGAFCLLRAESIEKQVHGALAANSMEQRSEDQVPAGDLNIGSMGSQGPGGPRR